MYIAYENFSHAQSDLMHLQFVCIIHSFCALNSARYLQTRVLIGPVMFLHTSGPHSIHSDKPQVSEMRSLSGGHSNLLEWTFYQSEMFSFPSCDKYACTY